MLNMSGLVGQFMNFILSGNILTHICIDIHV